jgi:hypothetical protein
MNIDMDARSCHTVIRGHVIGDIGDKALTRVDVAVGLWYNAAEPFEVELLIEDVLWTCARDLLRDGLFTATGIGDVRVWPCGDHLTLAIRLRNIGVGTDPAVWGTVVLTLPRLEMAEFVNATHKVVAPGRERINIDTCLAQLLGGDQS